jgi:hypothetical protein
MTGGVKVSSRLNDLMKKAMWLLIALFVIRCLISFTELKQGFTAYTIFGYAGEAIGAAALIVAAYERWLWKIDPTVKTPALKKKYTGTIISAWNGQQYDAEMEIKQSYLSINVIVKTAESKSKSLIAAIDEILGEQQLTYCYLNTPMASVRDRSAIHYGTAMICVDKPEEITGTYFTDRKSTGDMHFTAIE